MRRAVAVGIALIVTGCQPERPQQDLTNSADPVYRTDLADCPETPEWPRLRLADGRMADVTIVQLGETKLYIPMPWLRERGWKSKPRPPSQGVVASTGGASSFEPALDSRFRAGQYLQVPANCPGIVHVLERSARAANGPGPDFELTLYFDVSGTGPPPNDHSQQLPKVYAHNAVTIEFSHGRRASNCDLTKAWTLGVPPRSDALLPGLSAAGWTVTGSSRGGSISLVSEGRGGRDPLNPRFAAVLTHGYARLPFWSTETITATYRVDERYVPPERWHDFRDPIRELIAWLETPPAARDNGRRFALLPRTAAKPDA